MIELDDELLLRVGEFEAQLAAWSGRVGIPLLVLLDAPPPAFGRCVSCGEAAPAWRCPRCLEAAHVVLELAAGTGVSFTPRPPIVSAIIAEVEESMTERNLWRYEAHE